MAKIDRREPIRRLVIVRVAIVALAMAILLLGLTFAKYILDTPQLRRATLEKERITVIQALRNHRNPIELQHYSQYPASYGLKVYEGAQQGKLSLIAHVNAQLFPSSDLSAPESDPSQQTGFSDGALLSRDPGSPSQDRWLLNDSETIGEKIYRIQLVMIGDPAWRWWGVIGEELMDHVAIPFAAIVPALALAMFFSIGVAVRPLERIARQAVTLGAAVGRGERLTPLNAEGLPVEFFEVVHAINAMLARLERTLQLQKQFTSDAAHELRTPLAVLLLQVTQLPPGPTVDSIRESLEGVTGLVNQLLHLAQAEEADEVERQPTDVVATARKVSEDYATAAFTRRQTIEFNAPDRAVSVLGHPVLIETAIRNVVGNALKYSASNTVISVSVNAASEVIVDDRGPGIRDEQKELVFSRFWRADRRRSDGSGIGLALVRRIVELHQGSARIEDRAGGGSRFILKFAPP